MNSLLVDYLWSPPSPPPAPPPPRIKGDAKKALRAVIEKYKLPVTLTPHQSLILRDIEPANKADVIAILMSGGVKDVDDIKPIDRCGGEGRGRGGGRCSNGWGGWGGLRAGAGAQKVWGGLEQVVKRRGRCSEGVGGQGQVCSEGVGGQVGEMGQV